MVVSANQGGIPIVNDQNMLIGYLSQSDLIYCTQNVHTRMKFSPGIDDMLNKWVDYAPLTGTCL
jgi:predicted transcriptional regulator